MTGPELRDLLALLQAHRVTRFKSGDVEVELAVVVQARPDAAPMPRPEPPRTAEEAMVRLLEDPTLFPPESLT